MVESCTTAQESITAILGRVNSGDPEAFHELMPLVYHELRRIAEAYLRRESSAHTLQATALLHEAYLRLADYGGANYESRKHFFAIAARVMRRILVDHARARRTAKRGSGITVRLDRECDIAGQRDAIVLSLDEALTELANRDESKARVVEMRFFGGLTAEEISQVTDIPVHTVRRQLRSAQVWLRREIES